MKQALDLLNPYKNFLTLLVCIGLIGFTAYQISQITAVKPDTAYMELQRPKSTPAQLKASPQTIEKLRSLQPAGDTRATINPGKPNPFSLD